MFTKRFAHPLKCSDISAYMYLLQLLINYFMHRISILSNQVNNTFILDFKHNILNRNVVYPEFRLIEKYRSELCDNNQELEIFHQGAGTKARLKRRTIGSMARIASVSPLYGELLYRLAFYYKPDTIIELGTALGISTIYLALGNPKARVITVEGNPQLAEITSKNFAAKKLNNINLINSTFDNTMDRLIHEISKNTLVFIDGNHNYDATMRYFAMFEKIPGASNILVFDDINWSGEMMRAWKSITESAHAGILVDLFRMGILFQGLGINRQKFRLRYS
jgi:predicted O-methyltransferase YrrM